MGSLGGAALLGTVYCWVGNMAGGAVVAHRQDEVQITPGMGLLPEKGGYVSVQISF